VRFHTAGEEKSAVYDCFVPFNDKSTEDSDGNKETYYRADRFVAYKVNWMFVLC